ncbi:sodium-dependent dopamine transporter-like isoform X2 [Haliotis asinina]
MLFLYIVFTIISAIPCVFLEMVIGQFSQGGPIKVWNLCPPFRGIGMGQVVINLLYAAFYSALLAWICYYLYYSFSTNIPWAHCDNPWNTPTCISNNEDDTFAAAANASKVIYNSSPLANGTKHMNGMTSAEEFWKFRVLEITDSLEHFGDMRWPICGCLVIIYVLVYLFLFQGLKVSGKVVYVTVAVPYILITAVLIRGCLLPGSADGIYYFLYPHFERLSEPEIWIEACNLSMFSIGTAFGCLVTMAGHNKFNNNCFRDALSVVGADVFSAVYIGLAFFAVMGHVAHLRGVTVEAFQSSGFNLGFIVYPEAVASLPLPQLWSSVAFIMILTLGIDSMVPCLEIPVTALSDEYPCLARRRWLVIVMVIVPCFIFSLLYMSQGGIYVLTLVDWYAFFPSIAVFGMLDCFIVSWIYGTDRLRRITKMMWKKTAPRVLTFSLKYVCPGLLLIICGYSLYSYRPPKYGDYIYPAWATGVGWVISCASLMPLPVVFIWTVYNTEGNTIKEKLEKSLKPTFHWELSSSVTDTPREGIMETML